MLMLVLNECSYKTVGCCDLLTVKLVGGKPLENFVCSLLNGCDEYALYLVFFLVYYTSPRFFAKNMFLKFDLKPKRYVI